MLLVGLTGGIGSGKSTVARLLEARGAVVVDADAVAREVVEPGTTALAKLVERFGDGILASDGSLDRQALANVAFATDESRAALEAITHPAINEEFLRRVTAAPQDGIVVCDVPLLAESKAAQARGYPVVVVVEAPLELRLERLEARGVPRDDARRRIAAQATDEERRALATHTLDNSSDLAHLEDQVDALWPELLRRKDELEAQAKADAQATAEATAEAADDGGP